MFHHLIDGFVLEHKYFRCNQNCGCVFTDELYDEDDVYDEAAASRDERDAETREELVDELKRSRLFSHSSAHERKQRKVSAGIAPRSLWKQRKVSAGTIQGQHRTA